MTAPIETGDIAEFEEEFTSSATPGRTPLVIKLLVAATFVVILNETIMVNALPALIDEF
jgi:DHA2 family lincomycin resistance protein-like MFS transporter